MQCAGCGAEQEAGSVVWIDDNGRAVCATCASDESNTSPLARAYCRIRALEESDRAWETVSEINRRTLDDLGAPHVKMGALGENDSLTAARIRALAKQIKDAAQSEVLPQDKAAGEERVANAAVQHGVMMGVLRTLAIQVWGTREATAKLQVALYSPVIPPWA